MSSAIDGLKRDKEAEPAGSQAVKALLALREMVLAGELPAASRIAEVALAERLGVSRTPIRAALMRLEQEGLLEPLPGGRTRLTGTTWYTFDMAPTWYWTLWSDAILHAVHRRVLEHVGRVAVGGAGGA